MIFAWYGFALDHPEDWAPVHLTGSRKEGYVRIASPTRLAAQLRWKSVPSADGLGERLAQYLTQLERDAKRAKQPFDANIDEEDGRLVYRYSGYTFARGAIFFSEPCERVFFLEVVSTRSDSLLPPYRQLVGSFRSGAEGMERWALLGLDVRLPNGLKIDRQVLQAGHIALELSAPKVQVKIERWGFGEQLASKHGLRAWAESSLGLKNADVEENQNSVHLYAPSMVQPPTTALVKLQPELNQITVVSVSSRKPEWKPQWDWIV